jgi:hypothetical protein
VKEWWPQIVTGWNRTAEWLKQPRRAKASRIGKPSTICGLARKFATGYDIDNGIMVEAPSDRLAEATSRCPSAG